VEHAADERRRIDGRDTVDRGAACLVDGGHRGGWRARRLPHEKSALPARLHEALGQQLVVGRDHGVRADAMAPRALAHRGQPRTGCEQAMSDALAVLGGELLGQRGAGGAGQGEGIAGVHGTAVSVRSAVQIRQVHG
jgi:hypothetical protein